MAGFSGTPLAKKLGIKSEYRVLTLNAPDDLAIELPPDVSLAHILGGRADVIVAFFKELALLEARMKKLASAIFPAGGLWIAWRKVASKVTTDISADVVREAAFRCRLVDNKVCAIDETWTALRLVWRVEHRRLS